MQSPKIESPPCSIIPPVDDPEREIIIAVMGLTGNPQECLKVAAYQLRKISGTGKSHFIREVSGIQVPHVKAGSNSPSCKITPAGEFQLKR